MLKQALLFEGPDIERLLHSVFWLLLRASKMNYHAGLFGGWLERLKVRCMRDIFLGYSDDRAGLCADDGPRPDAGVRPS